MKRRSQFFIPTKEASRADSPGAKLLDRAGYVSQSSAGVYNLLPLGLEAVRRIEAVVREEMNDLGASEVLLPSLQSKQIWQLAGRWDDPALRQILYRETDDEYCFAPTHEELMTLIANEAVRSYRDLPLLLYQFQTKFRRELRPRAGLLRGREFIMKDLYSFHLNHQDHLDFYEQVAKSYQRIFEKLGVPAYRIKASGGVFGKERSDEFQVVSEIGEDSMLVDHDRKTGYNKELEAELSPEERAELVEVRGIEVGNIFHLGTKYSEAINLRYVDQSGKENPVVMGSYGIGITRLLGTIAELCHDEKGLILPSSVAPFEVVIVDLTNNSQESEKLARVLEQNKLSVLIDDRSVAAGVKLVEADLLGTPHRLVISPTTLAQRSVEYKHRRDSKTQLIELDKVDAFFGSLNH